MRVLLNYFFMIAHVYNVYIIMCRDNFQSEFRPNALSDLDCYCSSMHNTICSYVFMLIVGDTSACEHL